MNTPHRKEPQAESLYVHGPAIRRDTGLLSWMAAQREQDRPATLQLPILVESTHVAGEGGAPFTARLATAAADPDVITLQLDDSALGIALADRWRGDVAQRTRGAWLEGTWGATTQPPTFRVTRWLGPIADVDAGTPLFARRTVATESNRALIAAIEQLGSDASPDMKAAAGTQLIAAGTAAIPLLIASLGDGRVFALHDAVNRMNLPVHEAPPAPMMVVRTVGTRCEELLYRIITPSARTAVDFRAKVLSTQLLAVSDWLTFWSTRRTQSLAEIHDALAPLVDAYWAQGGIMQRVE